MRGHLEQRGRGSWGVRVDLPPGPNGRRRQQRVTIRGTRKDAEKRLAELLHQQDQGLPIDNSKLVLGDYLVTWLRDVVAVRTRPRTLDSYQNTIKGHVLPVLGGIPLQKLQAADVDRLIASLKDKGLSTTTCLRVFRILSKALKDAMKRGLVFRNVCQAVEPPHPGRYEVEAPEMDTTLRVLALAKGSPYHSLFTLLAYTGLRRGEALALRWANVDMERGVASIVESLQRLPSKGLEVQPTKSAAGRRGIALDPGTVNLLREHQGRQLLIKTALEGGYQDRGLVFTSPLGGYLDPQLVTKAWERLRDRAGYPHLRLHDLRHGHAAGLIKAGVHPKVVQDRLGHANAAFTMQVYGHVAAGLQEEAVVRFANLMAQEKVR